MSTTNNNRVALLLLLWKEGSGGCWHQLNGFGERKGLFLTLCFSLCSYSSLFQFPSSRWRCCRMCEGDGRAESSGRRKCSGRVIVILVRIVIVILRITEAVAPVPRRKAIPVRDIYAENQASNRDNGDDGGNIDQGRRTSSTCGCVYWEGRS